MRVLVTGGRDYRDQKRVDEALSAIHAATPIEVVIHGAASGADSLAADWARRRGVPTDPHPARWDDISHPAAVVRRDRRGRPYNAAAGPQRNLRMILEGRPHLCVALPGGRGTANMVAQALKHDVAVLEVDP